jgi:hypothetical protein
MARKAYDVTLKDLFDQDLPDLGRRFGHLGNEPLRVLESDLATTTAAADKVLRVGGREPWILHLEFQARRRQRFAEYLHLYNTLVEHKHRLPVDTVAVLLQPKADAPALNGVLEKRLPGRPPYCHFEYRVIRLWQEPAEAYLTGGVGLLPLAPLTNVAEAELPQVVGRMRRRLDRDASEDHRRRLWTATATLMGIRYPPDQTLDLLGEMLAMINWDDSSIIRWLKRKARKEALAEGREKGFVKGHAEGRAEGEVQATRELVLELGQKHFHELPAQVSETLAQIDDLAQLRQLALRVHDVASWDELLADVATAKPARRKTGRKRRS